MNSNNLIPCRFCGSDNIITQTSEISIQNMPQINGITICNNCGFEVKSFKNIRVSAKTASEICPDLVVYLLDESKELWIKRNEKNNPFIVEGKSK